MSCIIFKTAFLLCFVWDCWVIFFWHTVICGHVCQETTQFSLTKCKVIPYLIYMQYDIKRNWLFSIFPEISTHVYI